MSRRRGPQWHIYAGGTAAAEGKHAYDCIVDGKKYMISPYTTPRGYHAGYLVSVFPGEHHGYAGIDGSGHEVTVNSTASSFRSPNAAKRAAIRHMEARR